MTASQPVRRSRRIVELVASQPVADDESTQRSKYLDESEESESESEESSDEDEEFKARPVSRKRTKNPSTTSKKPRKKQQKESVKNAPDFAEQRQEFEDTYLFQALNDSESSIVELATEWIEQYKSGKDIAKRDFINLLLNAAGSFTQIEEHDVANNDSASDTIGEIQTFFKRQKIHEFYLISKKPEFKHLKKNYIEFVTQIVNISDEKGLLYDNVKLNEDEDDEDEEEAEIFEDTNVIEDMLVWLSSLSVSSIRALRYVSTLCLYTIETTLCKVIEKMNTSLEVFKKQMVTESSKKQQNKTVKSRIEQINRNIETYTNQSMILDSFIQDILNTTFIHRFKDIDPIIRADSMSSLGEWMDIYPEFFFKVTYLKYLGWVLSDENNQVRVQVVKTLVKLLKNRTVAIGSGLRQFLERFKGRVIEIAAHDVDVHVRLSSINLLVEINKNGSLEDSEIASIVKLVTNNDSEIFEIKTTPMNKKLLHNLLSFVSDVEAERTKETLSSVKQVDLPFNLDVIKYVTLIRLLQDSEDEQQQRTSRGDKLTLEQSQTTKIGKALFQLQRYSSNWEDLLKLFIYDINSNADLKKKTNKELRVTLDLSAEERIKLFQLILGNLYHLVETEDEDQLRIFIQNAKSVFKSIESNNIEGYSTFIQAFDLINAQDFEFDINEYNEIVSQLIKFFKNNEINDLFLDFCTFFKKLSKSTNEADSMAVTDLISETLIKFIKTLDSIKTLESTSSADDEDLYADLQNDFVLKFICIGKSFDISIILKEYEVKIQQIFDSHATHLNDELIVSTFKLLTSAISWRLNNINGSMMQEHDAMEEFVYIPKILAEFKSILSKEGSSAETFNEKFKYGIFLIFVDFLRILKNYFDSSPSNITNLEKFKENELSSFKLDEDLVQGINTLFLIKEYNLATVLNAELDRLDEESLNFMKLTTPIELSEIAEKAVEREEEDEDEKDEDEDKQLERELTIWNLEKELILVTSKILDLIKLEILKDDETITMDRLKLNQDSLGEVYPLLFVEDENEGINESVVDTQPTTPLNELSQLDEQLQKGNEGEDNGVEVPDSTMDIQDLEVPDIAMDEE